MLGTASCPRKCKNTTSRSPIFFFFGLPGCELFGEQSGISVGTNPLSQHASDPWICPAHAQVQCDICTKSCLDVRENVFFVSETLEVVVLRILLSVVPTSEMWWHRQPGVFCHGCKGWATFISNAEMVLICTGECEQASSVRTFYFTAWF